MKKLEQHFNNATKHIRMTHAEKDAMRSRLMRAIGTAPVRSPYQWLWAPRSFVALALVVIVVGSSGTAYAAEGSLPGAPLYSVKVNVIEPIRVALATTPAEKAQVHAEIAAARVEEAQTLAAKGDLTVQTAQEISTNYNEHATAALAFAEQVDTEAGIATSTPGTSVSPAVNVEHSQHFAPSSQNPSAPQRGEFPAGNSPTSGAVAPAYVSATLGSASTSSSTIEVSQTSRMPKQNFSAVRQNRSENSAQASTTLQQNDSAESAAGAGNATSTSENSPSTSLSGKLHAMLMLQSQILDQLDQQAHHRDQGKGEGDN